MSEPLRVLIVDDEELFRRHLSRTLSHLTDVGIGEVREARSSKEALAIMEAFGADVVLLDLVLDPGDRHGESGERLLRALMKRSPAPAVVIVTQLEDESMIDGLRKDGAVRHVSKPVTDEKLLWALGPLLRTRRGEPPTSIPPLPDGAAAAIRQCAPYGIPILVCGPTGAGKELVAREIHNQSGRKGSFVAVQPDAFPRDRLEAELFGWARGSFTGSIGERAGLLEEADGGTLFLDEIGEMPLELQSKLLRVLQEKRFRRLGENKEREARFRLVVATNRAPQEAVKEGRLREDLYFRFAGRIISLPPLRERMDDLDWIVPNLVRRFEEEYGRVFAVSAPAMQKLRSHPWPGNVRELANVLESAFINANVDEDAASERKGAARRADPSGSLIIRAEHIVLPEELGGRDGNHPGDGGLLPGLARRARLFENLGAVARNQVQQLEREGMRWTEITKVMGIGRATYFRIKAGRWPPRSLVGPEDGREDPGAGTDA